MKSQDRKFQAVFFDVDGVLYDSMPNHARAWVDSFKSVIDLDVPGLEFYLLEGMTGEPIVKEVSKKYLGKDLPPDTRKKIIALKEANYSALPRAEMIRGAPELVHF